MLFVNSSGPPASWLAGACILLALVAASCRSEQPPGSTDVLREIEAQLAQGVEATRNEDIEAYMDGLPADLVIYDESGEVISREQQRAYVLRDWAVITRTLDIEVVVDSMEQLDDSTALVWTSQRWERMMLRPDRPGEDTILTTQRHREVWRPTASGWRLYEVEELGGRVWVNGEPYDVD